MVARRRIGPELTVAALLEDYPEVRPALQALGIDACCGGGLTLAQVAEARRADVGTIVSSVQAAVLKSSSVPERKVRPDDSVRRILALHPETRTVFERFGLMGCGGWAGPDERIDLFAGIHKIDPEALLSALDEAIGKDPGPSEPNRSEARPVFPPFLKAAIASTLTLGASFGAYNLLVIHWALGPMPPSHNWVHAGFQIWGFVFLFIAGVAYHAAPRFLGTDLRHPRLARATLWLTLAGQILLAWGRFGSLVPASVEAMAAGALCQIAAVAVFAGILGSMARRARPRLEIFHAFLGAGTLGWMASALFLGGGAVSAILEGDTEAATGWNQAVYASALFGGTLAWIQGMFLRTGPAFLSLQPSRAAWLRLALVLGQGGALLAVVGSLRIGRPGAIGLMDLGLLGAALSAVAYVLGVRPFSSRGVPLAGNDRTFRRIVRMAFAASLVFAALGGAYAVADLRGGAPGLMHDGARHAFVLGFVTLLTFGMASRIVPVFVGAELRWPALRAWGAGLIFAGFLLREAQVVAVLFLAPAWLKLSGLSGIVAAAGVTLFGASILATLRPRPAAPAAAPGRVPLSLDANVASLIGSHPEALPLLIEAGFTPLANPMLRNTLARMVTVRQACAMHKVEEEALMAKLRRACPHEPRIKLELS